jgi:hypothetical protein
MGLYVLSVSTVLQIFHKKSVLWIRKYFFRSRIREAIKLRVWPDPDPTWTFLCPLKKVCCPIGTDIKPLNTNKMKY